MAGFGLQIDLKTTHTHYCGVLWAVHGQWLHAWIITACILYIFYPRTTQEAQFRLLAIDHAISHTAWLTSLQCLCVCVCVCAVCCYGCNNVHHCGGMGIKACMLFIICVNYNTRLFCLELLTIILYASKIGTYLCKLAQGYYE